MKQLPRIRWDRLYSRHCPHDTDPFSRHARIISSSLRAKRSGARKALAAAGYDPDHWADALEQTVKMLWEARAKMRRLSERR